MKMILAILFSILLVGCGDPIVSTHAVGEPVTTNQSLTGEEPGFCAKCGFTMEMKYECSAGIWRNCPYPYTADVTTQLYQNVHKSGKTSTYTRTLGETNVKR